MLIKNTVLWPFVRGCGTVFLCGEDGRDWKGEEVWMDGRQRPETALSPAVSGRCLILASRWLFEELGNLAGTEWIIC